MREKLCQSRGETLVEVLAAVVIAALSAALLFGGIMASSAIDHGARTEDKLFYEALSAAERQEGAGTELPVTVSREGASRELDAKCYGGEGVRSYAREGAP